MLNDYPLGKLRSSYGQEFLSRLDTEVSDYLNKVRPVFLAACADILRDIETHE